MIHIRVFHVIECITSFELTIKVDYLGQECDDDENEEIDIYIQADAGTSVQDTFFVDNLYSLFSDV